MAANQLKPPYLGCMQYFVENLKYLAFDRNRLYLVIYLYVNCIRMDKAKFNEYKICDLSEFHNKVRNKLFHDKAISQSENPATYRKSISLLDTSVLDTTNAEKLIQYMQIKRGYNNRPRLLLNSCSPEKAKRIWPIEVEKLIEGDDKRKENASKTSLRNKSNAVKNDSTPKSHLTQDLQPIVSLKKLPNDLISQDVNQASKNARKDHLSFHPVIASTPNQGKTRTEISIISDVSDFNETSSDSNSEPLKQPTGVLNEADPNTKSKTNTSKVIAAQNKTKNAPKHTTFVENNIPENREHNIEKENNVEEQNFHSNQNCDDDDDDRTLKNNSKTLISNERNKSKNNKTRNEISAMQTKQELKSKLRKSKASNLSLRKALIQSRLTMLQNTLATSTKKTANEFTQTWISSPADNNNPIKTPYREKSTTSQNCNLEANQQIETSEDINNVRKTIGELRKDYGQAPFVVIPIHQTFHSPTASENLLDNKTGHKRTEVLERSQKQSTKNQSNKNHKSSDKSNLNTSSLIRLPSLDDLLTDDEEPSPSQPLDLRVNICNTSVHTEITTATKASNRSSIKNLNPSDILVDDIIYYTQKQRNDEKSCSAKSKTSPAQSRLGERRKSVMNEFNASRAVTSPVPESIAIDASESEEIVDDIYPNKEPEWHKNLYQSTKEKKEKKVPSKKRGRPKKRGQNKNVSSSVTPYLELSKIVNKRKKRTQNSAKRKLYSKGRSDDELSNSGSNSLEERNLLSVSSTNTPKDAKNNQNESKQKSKKESNVKSSYAEKKDEAKVISKMAEDNNDDNLFVKPTNPVTKLKQNKKTKKKLNKISRADHFEGSQSADGTVSDTNKKEQTKEKEISEQSKNIKMKSNNSAIVKNNIEIPLESISVEPELQDWAENDITTPDKLTDIHKEVKQRRSNRLRSNLKESSVRTDLVNHNTNIDVVNSSSNIRSQQTLIEKESTNLNEEHSEQNEKTQKNASKKTHKAKEKQSEIKRKNEQKRLNRNKNPDIEALLEDNTAQDCLRRSKRTHRPPIQYWTNSGQAQELIDLKSIEVKELIKTISKRNAQKKKNAQSQSKSQSKSQSTGINEKQDDRNEQTVCDLFDQLKENLEDTLRKRKESPRISEISNKKRLKLTENNEIDSNIRKLSREVMPPPPAPPPPRNKPVKPVKTNSTLNSTERSLPSYIRSNANAAASSDDGIGTDENNGMSTLVTESANTVYSSQKRQDKDGTKDFLLDWLMYSSPPYLKQNRDIFKLLSSDKIKIACIENLVINEVNGVEYANYTGKDNNYGYMKFYPNSQKPRSKTKNKEMKLLILFGRLQIILDEKCFNVKNGDFVTIPQGTRYIINNNSDQCAILFFIKP